MKYNIRKVIPEEAGDVADIIADALRNDFPYKPKTVKSYIKTYDKKHFAEVINGKNDFIFGAYLLNELVGVAVVEVDYGGVLSIDWLVIKKDYRGKGIGTSLIEEVEKWGLTHKFHYLYFFTETEKNIKFYKKRGFELVGKHTNSWFGEDEFVLEKHLKDKPFDEIFNGGKE